jgi:hypothetical protein
MASIKCGNCKASHDSVAAVKACYSGTRQGTVNLGGTKIAYIDPAELEMQAMEAAGDRAESRAATAAKWAREAAYVGGNKTGAPAPRPSQAPAAKVVEGRYAVEFDGKLRFFKIDVPTEGRWTGYTFVKEQASDELYPVKNRDRREGVLAAIRSYGIEAAMVRYGHELGVCGRCGRTLTDEDSRAAGIGPICASKGF